VPAWTDSGLVFTSSVGMVIEPRNLSRLFDELIEAARVRRIRFHDLRHTCASRPRSAVLSKRLLIRGNRGERMTGIEPALSAWEADVLPLNYIRLTRRFTLRCVPSYPTRDLV
jgi:integrase